MIGFHPSITRDRSLPCSLYPLHPPIIPRIPVLADHFDETLDEALHAGISSRGTGCSSPLVDW